MSGEPLVSVIMSMFNAERFLEQAVRSILEQTYRNFEFIIIDDGSKDRSWDIASRLGQHDSRIHLIRLENNQGVSVACNKGLQKAQGKYIARMDADDISLPDRFLRQVEFMECHPEVGVLGCGMRYMDEFGNLLGVPPTLHGDLSIRWALFFENPFINSTVMIRKSLLDRYDLKYEPALVYGEDYDFWCRFLLLTKGENLPEIFLYYRLHPNSLSHIKQAVEQGRAVDVSSKAVAAHLPDAPISLQEIKDLQNAIKGTSPIAKYQRASLVPVYFKIWDEFYCLHHNEADIFNLEQDVIAWAARLILYPPFQPHTLKSLSLLTKKNRKWLLYFLKSIPYFWARRRIR